MSVFRLQENETEGWCSVSVLRCVTGQTAGQSTDNFAINPLRHDRYTEQ
nr:MAG TPA: hypothetical protein [Caudoviricetes sp.]